jgi:hypothetical protein
MALASEIVKNLVIEFGNIDQFVAQYARLCALCASVMSKLSKDAYPDPPHHEQASRVRSANCVIFLFEWLTQPFDARLQESSLRLSNVEMARGAQCLGGRHRLSICPNKFH